MRFSQNIEVYQSRKIDADRDFIIMERPQKDLVMRSMRYVCLPLQVLALM